MAHNPRRNVSMVVVVVGGAPQLTHPETSFPICIKSGSARLGIPSPDPSPFSGVKEHLAPSGADRIRKEPFPLPRQLAPGFACQCNSIGAERQNGI